MGGKQAASAKENPKYREEKRRLDGGGEAIVYRDDVESNHPYLIEGGQKGIARTRTQAPRATRASSQEIFTEGIQVQAKEVQ